MTRPVPVAFDMETQDPDDLVTLLFLTAHPALELKAVTVTPGSRHQVAVVREALLRTDHLHVPIGSKDPDYPKVCVSAPHWKLLGETGEGEPEGIGADILAAAIRNDPDLTVITGAPLSNLHRMFELYRDMAPLHRWIGQGGFVGANIVPEQDQLDKFRGKTHVPTFNFGGDLPAARFLLETDLIAERFLVGKNVCHGVVYDRERHDWFAQFADGALGFELIHRFLGQRLAKGKPKKMHDPLAATVAVTQKVCDWEWVHYEQNEKKHWGAVRLNNPTRPASSGAVRVNEDVFWRVFAGEEANDD